MKYDYNTHVFSEKDAMFATPIQLRSDVVSERR